MACTDPLTGYRNNEGKVKFRKSNFIDKLDPDRSTVACGQCIGCKLERSRQWAVRIMHEASQYPVNSFITLTYDNQHLAKDLSLNVKDWQDFAQQSRNQLRRDTKARGQSKEEIPPFRYFHCGEYGDRRHRPHLHACIFGDDYSNDRIYSHTRNGNKLYRSARLDQLWKRGDVIIGDLTFESAAYVARYCLKKITGTKAKEHYHGRKPEYTTMSRRPGIGKAWFDLFKNEVYPDDFIVSRGFPATPPRYYDGQYEIESPDEMALIKERRIANQEKHKWNQTPARLHVRDTITKAKLALYERDF